MKNNNINGRVFKAKKATKDQPQSKSKKGSVTSKVVIRRGQKRSSKCDGTAKPNISKSEVSLCGDNALPRLHGLRQWGDIKRAIDEAGVVDSDLVFLIDIGPELDRVYVTREKCREYVMVQIGDHAGHDSVVDVV